MSQQKGSNPNAKHSHESDVLLIISEVPKTLLAVYAGTEAYSRVLTWNDLEQSAESPLKLL